MWEDLPLTRCTGGNWTCSNTDFTRGDIFAGGIIGAHGGTGMSGLGGSLRLGELVRGGDPIRHVLAVAPNCPENCFACAGQANTAPFRWPAVTGEECINYKGRVEQLVHGALLALPRHVDISKLGLETEPGRMIAWTLQNYGAYIVENGTPDIYRFSIECGANGCVKDQFRSEFGMSMQVENGATNPWQRDVWVVLFPLLAVVDSWDAHAHYKQVRSSAAGAEGPPLQPWASPLPRMPLLPIEGAGMYIQERGSGMCLSLTRNSRGRAGKHVTVSVALSLADCDAAMYPTQAWLVQPVSKLVNVKAGNEQVGVHGCADGLVIRATSYGQGFSLNAATGNIQSEDCAGKCAVVSTSPPFDTNELVLVLGDCAGSMHYSFTSGGVQDAGLKTDDGLPEMITAAAAHGRFRDKNSWKHAMDWRGSRHTARAPPPPPPPGRLNAKDFGAVGDGRADDTAALQRAIDAAQTEGKALFVPGGSYGLSGPLFVHCCNEWCSGGFDAAQTHHGLSMAGAGEFLTFLFARADAPRLQSLLLFESHKTSEDDPIVQPAFNTSVQNQIADLSLSGGATEGWQTQLPLWCGGSGPDTDASHCGADYGIYGPGLTWSLFQRVSVYFVRLAAVRMYYCWYNRVEDCNFRQSQIGLHSA
eukprot:SAG22_NODE_150_length_17426_cov_8.082588_6_plen_644_part_00